MSDKPLIVAGIRAEDIDDAKLKTGYALAKQVEGLHTVLPTDYGGLELTMEEWAVVRDTVTRLLHKRLKELEK